jgi:hypothetical protein
LARAKEHLDALQRDIEDFGDMERHGDVYALDTEIEYDAQGTPWKVGRIRILREPPREFGILVADAVNNMRSSLDMLVTQLLALEGEEPTRQSGFPIFAEQPTKKTAPRLENALVGLDKRHRTAIKRLQPYKHPRSPIARSLVTLAALDNASKHRFVPPVLAFTGPPDGGDLSGTIGPSGRVYWAFEGGPLKEGRPWFKVSADAQVKIDVDAAIYVEFGAAQVSLGGLREIHSNVVGVVESFAADFPA